MILRAPKGYLDSTTEPGNAMPNEKNTPQNQRYLAPSLSSSGLRTPNTPLTPRVAGSTLSQLSTPLLRRATRPGDGGSPPRDDSSSLSTNITPRSGSRKTRISSTNTTPTGTPTGTPDLESRLPTEALSYGGGTPRPQLRSAYTRPTVFCSGSQVGGGQERSQSQASQNSQSSSKFFYASDVKPTTSAPAQKPRQLGHKHSGLLYGKGPGSTSGYSSASSSVNTVEERSKSKFFHANGTPDATSHNSLPLPTPGYSRAGSTVSSASLTQPPRLAQPKNPSRPVSLNKLDNGGSSYFPPPKAPSGQSSPGYAPLAISPESMSTVGASANELPAPILARSISGAHKKSLSIGRADVRSSAGSAIGSEIPTAKEPVTPFVAASIPLPEDDTEDESVVDNATVASGLRSPVKAGNTLERMNELAAEARRERKVMDLEITNSSLAAINRTLEREMRKQKAELARYRRLSRSGRLSILPGEVGKKKRRLDPSLGGVDEKDEENNEGDDMDEDEEEEDSLDPEADDDRSLSSTALAESDAKQQKRDEKRLQLDLTKHQQMLADSQRMNQSLKRCMSWTEELIKEGKKALEYQVLASEIELGGRVLVADEHDEHDDAVLSARLNGLAYNHEEILIEDGSEHGSDHLGIDGQTDIV